MRKLSGLLAAVLMSGALAGCGAQAPFGMGGLEAEPQTRADEAVANVPDPGDELGRAKEYFRNRNFGLAERYFRLVIEKSPNDLEAWLGLAAAHDQLGRFDLADREYAQVLSRGGTSYELLNNRGYSYMIRGDFKRARRDFLAAQKLDPGSEFVRNNLRDLDRRAAGRS